MTIRNNLIDSIFYNNLITNLSTANTSPVMNDLYNRSSGSVDQIMSLDPNKIGYQDIISAYAYNDGISSITSLFSSLNIIAQNLTSSYTDLSSDYQALYEKMKNSLAIYKKDIDVITDKLCLGIDHLYSNELLESKCGHFGNYLTLPYFINTASVYNNSAAFSITSDATIQYSNLGNITSLPFTDKPSFKLLSQNSIVTTNIKVIVASALYNAFYLNIPSDKITNVKVNLQTTSGVVSSNFNSGEIFFSFDQSTFSVIELVITSNNYNPGKPYSMVISDMMLFEKLEFMTYGVFKSTPLNMDKMRNINSLTMSNDSSSQEVTNINQYLSISNDTNVVSYNKVESNKYLDISSYYLNKSKDYIASDSYSLMTITYNNDFFDFYKIPFTDTDELWDIEYKKASIISGLNVNFMNQTGGVDQRYENWTQDGNYYVTYLMNFSDNITLNIGNKSFILNDKEVTGNVIISTGVSKIKVLEKDINFVNVTSHNQVVGDSLYLNNFAYLFTGLPEFGSNGLPIMVTKTFSVNSQSVLYMNEPFISSGMIVVDDNNNQYRLHMSKNVSMKGTYSIDPSKGIIKVNPIDGTKSITVSYYRCSQSVTPSGILFADLLTFAPITSLLDPTIGSTIFSIDGTYSEKVLYVPKAPRGPGGSTSISHTQVLYNNINEPIYLSAMIEMQTTNKYITPAIKSLTLSIK